ncbi:hypothetical protein LJ707_14060 [Mucilaginibacter sp. UR6-1]|uniref:hypothetical protein n=1 Tax=Mucilaginibacter sp. UR6-1 TaxID=1435643 RepID=UPI001E5B2760|nr:hypothetical protein [Mucilaginibacter sp. UR6-1]MCC8410059.1 hypothetical protein [Mucilaginibacter sp. UR6-1]
MSGINQKLPILYDFLVDNYSVLKAELVDLIHHPEKIDDTNKFASLLAELNSPDFVEPLLQKINHSIDTDVWRADFMYAAIEIIDNIDQDFDIPAGLMENLIDWLLNNTGELAWKAASLLKYNESEQANEGRLQKLQSYDSFFLVYVECILGLLRSSEGKYIDVIRQIANDPDRAKELKEFCEEVLEKYDDSI